MYNTSEILSKLKTIQHVKIFNKTLINYTIVSYDKVYTPINGQKLESRDTTIFEKSLLNATFKTLYDIYDGKKKFNIEYKKIPMLGLKLWIDMGEQCDEITEDQALAIIFQELKNKNLPQFRNFTRS